MTSNLPALVSAEWVAAELGQPDLVIFDATYYLPQEGKHGAALYAEAHLPGARFFDIDLIADPGTRLPHMVPSAARFETLMRALGVCGPSRVVFYDQKGIFSAPRGWWLMGLFGHDQAAVLDGGLPAWRAAGQAVQSGAVAAPASGDFQARLRVARLRGMGDVLQNLASQRELLLDARSAARFGGTVPEPRPGLRAGHIPGAINLPYTELLNADGTMQPAAALRARFAAAGVGPDRAVISSCGSGVSAAVLTLGLQVAGLKPGALYDGSWTEWGSDPEAPLAR